MRSETTVKYFLAISRYPPGVFLVMQGKVFLRHYKTDLHEYMSSIREVGTYFFQNSSPVQHHRPLALPLGELSPQATERALAVTFSVYPLRPRFARPPLPTGEARVSPAWLSLRESCHRRRLRGSCSNLQRLPSPSSLRSATSPNGRGKSASRLALPPGELSPQVTERALAVTFSAYPLRPRFARPPLPRGEARNARRFDWKRRAVCYLMQVCFL